MNTKRILFWACFIIVLALIIWGLIAAMNKGPGNAGKTGVPAPVTAADHVRGNPQAPVTMIEYEDFQCPACATYFPIVERLFNESSSTMKLVFRHFPLDQVLPNGLVQHPNALPAAKASEAASNQGKFWEMYSLLYANQNDWAEKSNAEAQTVFDGYATTLGLNMATFKADEVASTTLTKITAEQDEGNQIGINHTPTYFVNGKETTFSTYDEIKAIIDAAATSTAQ